MPVRVKICGITRREDALRAVDHGAWAVGFIFYEGSPRNVSPDDAAEIARVVPDGVEKVGVFVNRPTEDVRRIITAVGLTGVQLHGDEPPEYARAIDAPLRIKAFSVAGALDVARMHAYQGVRYLLDTARPGKRGGTGESFDWSVVADARASGAISMENVIIAGGISPGNVVDAFLRLGPFAVDASSGVEERPGVKSAERLAELFQALRDRLGGEGPGKRLQEEAPGAPEQQ